MSHSPSVLPSTRLSRPSTRLSRLAIALGLAAASCAQPKFASPAGAATAPVSAAATGTSPGNLDVLFMIDNSSSTTVIQEKLASQIPGFLTALQNLPMGLPNLHIAVVSSDMGAPGDVTSSIMCTRTGDDGQFRVGFTTGAFSQPSGLDGGSGGSPGGNDAGALVCPGARLNSGATFISDVDGVANYAGDLAALLSCMTALGDKGCGFEHQLASISRALGADGSPVPATNVGFLRPDAQLAIIVLTDEDDCSAPAGTSLYSLKGYQQNIGNPMGPIANYRCNEYGHLCVDPAATGPSCAAAPPLTPPADLQGTAAAPTLDLTDCVSDDSRSWLMSSVNDFANGIKALKADPANQIVVGAITAPPTPYTVAWVPAAGGQNPLPGELWPQVEHSCGPAGGDDVNPLGQTTNDGSFGDPAVRIAQWVKAFGANGVMASICDGSYANAFAGVVSKIGEHLQGGSSASSSSGDPGASVPICANGLPGYLGGDSSSVTPKSGLQNGGCDVAAGRPTAPNLGALLVLAGLSLGVVRRRRVSARRSSLR